MTYKISTEQTRMTGDILGIAVVERLDRIVELLETVATSQAEAIGHARRLLEPSVAPVAAGLPPESEATK